MGQILHFLLPRAVTFWDPNHDRIEKYTEEIEADRYNADAYFHRGDQFGNCCAF